MKIFAETERLVLRSWKSEDLSLFAKINASREVCKFLPKVLNKEESDNLAKKIIGHFDERGFGMFALELKRNRQFIGFTGLHKVGFEAHFTPAYEIGWRLSAEHHNKGYATEAAIAAKDYAFYNLGLDEIVSFTAENNIPSRRVMEKIGMTHSPSDDFDHPNLTDDSPLLRHVLYRLKKH